MLSEKQINALYRYSMALTNNDAMAYDLVHEAIVKMSGRLTLKPVAYAKRVMRNLFYDQYKRSSKEDELNEEELEANEIQLEDVLIQREELEGLIKGFSPTEREILFQIAVEERSYKDVAKSLDIKIGTLLSKVHRLKKNLQTKGRSL